MNPAYFRTLSTFMEIMETDPDIVIIGAGPSGLVAALTLLQEGQKVAIYDAFPKGQNGSRAAGVHAHTIEVTLLLFRNLPLTNTTTATSHVGICRAPRLKGDQGARRSELRPYYAPNATLFA